MSVADNAPVRQAATVVLPQGVQSAEDLREGDSVVVQFPTGQRVLLRLAHVAATPEVEKYTPERRAEFLLSNAISDADYQAARDEVLALGIDPDKVPHFRHSQG